MMKTVGRRGQGGTVKRAISLPRATDDKALRLLESRNETFSGLVRDAIDLLYRTAERQAMEKQYSEYYAEERNRGEDSGLAHDFSDLAADHWPL